MTRIERALIRLETDLKQLDLHWALIGGLAVSARSEPRTTRDIDIAVAVADDGKAEKVVREFQARGYRLHHSPLEQVDTGRMATVRFLGPGEGDHGVIVDLLFASSGIEQEVVASAQILEVPPGLAAPVASTSHLLALKTLAGRNQDLTDIRSLLQVAGEKEIQEAREALDLIAKRGFDRGKNLQAEFAERQRENR